jgi:flagellar motor switch protein FliG
MVDKRQELTGTQNAAVLLMSLGEEHAARILRKMGPREVEKVGHAMSSLANVSSSQVSEVMQGFIHEVQGQSGVGIASDEYVSKVLEQALGAEKAGGVINRVLEGRNARGLEALKWMDPEDVADVIRSEHPQIIAIVLSQLDPDQAALVLSKLPEEQRTDVLLRVARMDTIHPGALNELDRVLAKQFSITSNIKSPPAGGAKVVADILNVMGTEEESAISASIIEVDKELGEEIKELMFVFDNLKEINDRGIQALLREVSTDVLVVALKGADDIMQEKIFTNMSKRAAEMLRDDLETKGPVKLSEVHEAQKEILVVAQRMAESGDLVMGGKGGEEYV